MSVSNKDVNRIIEIINRSKTKRNYKESKLYSKNVFDIYIDNLNDFITFIDLMNLSDDLEEYSVFDSDKVWKHKENSYCLFSYYRLNKRYKNNLKEKIKKNIDSDLIFRLPVDLIKINEQLNDITSYKNITSKIKIKKDEKLKVCVKNMVNNLKENRIDKDKNDVLGKHIMSYVIEKFLRLKIDEIDDVISNKITSSVSRYFRFFEVIDEYTTYPLYLRKYPFYITDKEFINKVSEIFDLSSKIKNDGLIFYIYGYKRFRYYYLKTDNNSNIYEINPKIRSCYLETLPNNVFIYQPPIFQEVYRYLRNKEFNVENVIEAIDIYYKKYEKLVNEVFDYIDKESDKICESIKEIFKSDDDIKRINDKIFNTDEYNNFVIIKALSF